MAISDRERELIQLRTKQALAAKKKQGFKLGTPKNLTDKAREKGTKKRIERAANNKENKQASELISLYRGQGLSYQNITDKLNENGYQTRNGKQFYKSTVKMLLDRIV